MLDFLSAIADSLGVVLHFISTTIFGLFYSLVFAFQSITWLEAALVYFPRVLFGFAFLGIVLSILFHLIGR